MKTIKKIMLGLVMSALMVINLHAQPKSEIIDNNETKINWAGADTLYTFQFDSESNSWTFFQREIRRFDKKDKPTENLVQSWDLNSHSWINYLKENYSYDEHGFEVEKITQEWNNNYKNWINANLTTTIYNGRHKEEILFQEWKKPAEEWFNIIKYLIKYNEVGKEDEITVSLYNGITQDWDNHKKFEMEFSNPFTPPTNVVSDSWINGKWKTEGMYDLEYNSRGKKTQEIRYTWSEGLGAWIEGIKLEITYDKKGNQLVYQQLKFDNSKKEWTNFNKQESVYNEDGYMTEKTEYVWNRNMSQWEETGKFKFTTDSEI